MRISVGIDVAKDVHWICALDQDARVLIDRAFDNTQEAIDDLVAELSRLPSGTLTIGLDVMGSFAAFLQAALLAEGFSLVHVPGIAVNRARVGFAKSDPRDARVIAEQVRTRSDLRAIRHDDDTTIAIRLLVSRRRDLTQDQTRRLSRMHQLLASVHPGLERALDLTAKAPIVLLTRFVTPREIKAAGRGKIVRHLRKRPGLRQPERWAETAIACAKAQRIAVPGEVTVANLVRELAREAIAVRERLTALDKELGLWSATTLTEPSSVACPAWGPCLLPSSSQLQATSPLSLARRHGQRRRPRPGPASVRTLQRYAPCLRRRQGPQARPLHGGLLRSYGW